ncbi:MAG TPA: 4-alpha-glucanotransferase [Acidisarcina sp.]|nr:4-alpha-glucanotransferase [Acidisarcina sp.]
MPFERSSGLLLHITSLPSYGGIGDMGPAAYAFADFLAASKQRLWQVLPLGPTGFGNSPYATLSAFAGNPLLISLEHLSDWGWIAGERLAGMRGRSGEVDFHDVERTKLPLLDEAARNFLTHKKSEQWKRFEQYCRDNQDWLDDYVLYAVLARKLGTNSWKAWPEEYAQRHPEALEKLRKDAAEELTVLRIIQFAFDEQWSALRDYALKRGVRFIGDVAIFVNYDSVDVWTNRDIFELDKDGWPIRVSGVPPDYFSKTGQRWGNPLYRWDVLEKRGFDWWVSRIRRAHSLYDVIRLDHFRGFEAYWAIPAAEETAVHGEWVPAPGEALFARLREALGDLPFIAEDLGLITPEVERLREQFGMPGMRILQFGFGNKGAHNYLPHKYVTNTVAYTGTHDNDTSRGWWESLTNEEEKAAAIAYLTPGDDGPVWSMIRAISTSVADICLIPVQDVLDLGSDARMNTPSRADANWCWRCPEGVLTESLATRLAALTEVSDRDAASSEALKEDSH